MTILSLSPSVQKVLSCGQDTLSGSSSHSASSDVARPLPRINLRKRPHNRTCESSSPEDLPYVTSDFLSNLFADAAEASIKSQNPCKKSRLSKSKSHKSFVMPEDSNGNASPVTTITSFFDSLDENDDNNHLSQVKNNQSKCVAMSVDAPSASDTPFPSLPTAVSESSCSSQSLNASVLPLTDQQSSNTDTTGKDSYGWFVETDHDIKSSSAHEDSAYGALSPAPAADLAFSAYKAPEPSKLDAEVEWAKAADTVDDVLGDFF